MGGGVSTNIDLKDEYLSLKEAKELFGDQFDQYVFNTLKNEHGQVKRDDVKNVVSISLKLVETTLNRAVHAVYVHYAGEHGEMKTRQFCDMCRDAKVLNKAKFSNADANILYGKILKQQRTPAKVMSFELFRKDAIPAISGKHGVEEAVILSKFGGITLPQENVFDESLRETVDSGPETSEQNKAAVKLQSLTRQKSAAKEMEELKKIQSSLDEVKDEFFSTPGEGQLEDKIFDVFCTKCKEGVMMLHQFVKLLKEACIMGKGHTVLDCKVAFFKAKLLAKGREVYKSGLIANKFITYRVFREVLLPCTAERFGMNTDNVLDCLRRVQSDNIEASSRRAQGTCREFLRGTSMGKNRNISFQCEDWVYEEVPM